MAEMRVPGGVGPMPPEAERQVREAVQRAIFQDPVRDLATVCQAALRCLEQGDHVGAEAQLVHGIDLVRRAAKR